MNRVCFLSGCMFMCVGVFSMSFKGLENIVCSVLVVGCGSLSRFSGCGVRSILFIVLKLV